LEKDWFGVVGKNTKLFSFTLDTLPLLFFFNKKTTSVSNIDDYDLVHYSPKKMGYSLRSLPIIQKNIKLLKKKMVCTYFRTIFTHHL
jgi:hypothetical protein